MVVVVVVVVVDVVGESRPHSPSAAAAAAASTDAVQPKVVVCTHIYIILCMCTRHGPPFYSSLWIDRNFQLQQRTRIYEKANRGALCIEQRRRRQHLR